MSELDAMQACGLDQRGVQLREDARGDGISKHRRPDVAIVDGTSS